MTLDKTRLNAFPLFLHVQKRPVVIIGNGEKALARARLLGQSSASLTIIADQAEPQLVEWASANHASVVTSRYDRSLLDKSVLVFAATDDEALDRRIVADARALGIPANAMDRPDCCDFYMPAMVNRAPVAIAIGTEGSAPVLAQLIRTAIERMLPPSLGQLARLAGSLRKSVEKHLPENNSRRLFWNDFFSGAPARAMENGEAEEARRAARQLLEHQQPTKGRAWLVGSGPGAVDLLTLQAQRLLMQADIIVHDATVPEAIVAMGRREAERLPLGRHNGQGFADRAEINALLIDLARQGKQVVHLHSGNPQACDNARRQMAALRDAGIDCHIVPGIAAVDNAPAAAASTRLRRKSGLALAAIEKAVA